MTYEHQMWLLDMVDELRLQPRVAKIRAKTAEQEWEMLDGIVSEALTKRDKEEG